MKNIKNKKKIILIAIPLIIITTVVLIILVQRRPQNETYEEIVTFLETDPAPIISLRSVLGEFDARPGRQFEIVVEVNIWGDLIELLYNNVDDGALTQLLNNFLYSGESFFVEQVSLMREQLNFINLTLTINYIHDENIIVSQYFNAR